MLYKFFIFISIIISIQLAAQDNIDSSYIYTPAVQNDDTLGLLEIKQSKAITSLLNKKIIINEARTTLKGFRIQLLSTSGSHSRDKANKAMAEFMMEYDSVKIYLVYHSPYFKVRIGDFRSKMNAKYFLQNIKKEYPQAFVVADKVNIPEKETLEKELNNSPN